MQWLECVSIDLICTVNRTLDRDNLVPQLVNTERWKPFQNGEQNCMWRRNNKRLGWSFAGLMMLTFIRDQWLTASVVFRYVN